MEAQAESVMSKRYARQIAFNKPSCRTTSLSVKGIVCDRWLTNKRCTGRCKFLHEWTFTSQRHLNVAIKKARCRIADADYMADCMRSSELFPLCVSCVDDTGDASHVSVSDVPALLSLPSAVSPTTGSISIPFVP